MELLKRCEDHVPLHIYLHYTNIPLYHLKLCQASHMAALLVRGELIVRLCGRPLPQAENIIHNAVVGWSMARARHLDLRDCGEDTGSGTDSCSSSASARDPVQSASHDSEDNDRSEVFRN